MAPGHSDFWNSAMIEWNIQTRAHACHACARPFADQQTFHTLLFDARDVYERVDVCGACWSAQYNDGATSRKGFVSHWQGLFEVPAPVPEPIQKENAETLLRKLIERGDPRYGAAMFILAVMLERKRLLKVKDQLIQDGRRTFLYEHPRSGDLFTIIDPDLHLDQLEAVQRDVAHLLEHGFDRADDPLGPIADPTVADPTTPLASPDPSSGGTPLPVPG
jgi:hypothetical protein